VRLVDGVQTNFPELGRLSAKQPMGTTLLDGPRRRTTETLPAVVGYAGWGLVGRYITLEHSGDNIGRNTTHVPGDCEWGTGWDDLTEAGRGDGVPAWGVTDWCLRASRGCGGNANKGDETCDGETHV